jgi:hypothetical protein
MSPSARPHRRSSLPWLLAGLLAALFAVAFPGSAVAAKRPAPPFAVTQDRDLDGRLDAIRVFTGRAVAVTSSRRGWPAAVQGRRVTAVEAAGSTVTVLIAEGAAPDTGGRPTIRLLRPGRARGAIVWRRGRAAIARTLRARDGAAPVPVSARMAADSVLVTFSERLRPAERPALQRRLRVTSTSGVTLRLASVTVDGAMVRARVTAGTVAGVAIQVGRRESRRIAVDLPGGTGPSVPAPGAEPAPAGPRLAAGRSPVAWLENPIDPANQLKAPWGTLSHWMQPWRGYLDTQPASALRNAVGINFNVWGADVGPTARLLAASGVRRARVEASWGAMDYADPSKLAPAEDSKLRAALQALKANGIRPLILLNSNHGQPAPLQRINLSVTAAAAAGATTLKLSPASAALVVPDHTGLDGRTQYKAAQAIITAVAPDGAATLAKPLPWALAPGTYSASTLRFLPFAGPYAAGGTAGDPNPDYLETLSGWQQYVGGVAAVAKDVLGSQDFDLEVWNEMTFGSDFLRRENYFAATTGWGDITNQLPRDTVAWIRDPAHGLERVGVTNGFESQRPWGSGATSPPGLSALSKHPYKGVRHFPQDAQKDGIRPIDAFGNTAGTSPSPNVWLPDFTPQYTALFPEYYLTQIQTETLIRDLSPITTTVTSAKTPHGRFTHPDGSAPPQLWLTEVNLDSSGVDLSTPGDTTLVGQGLTTADVRRFQAKTVLRYLSSYVNKGAGALYFYAAKAGNLSLVDPSFFAEVSRGRDPGTAAGGVTTDALRRLTSAFQGPESIGQPRSLTLDRVGDFEGHRQFAGDGTVGRPDLFNRDALAVLPFQVTDRRFVIPTYVMTRNLATVYRQDAPASDPTRLDLPPELYRLQIGNLGTCAIDASATDPLSGTAVPVDVVSCARGTAVIDMPVTDSPRLLTIDLRN